MTDLTRIEEPAAPVDPMLSMIERIASDPASDIAKLEQMLAMKERLDSQNARAAHAAAFAKASAELPQIPMRGVGHNRMPYAKLCDIVSHTRPVLSAHGLVLSFGTHVEAQTVIVTARLAHQMGHVETVSIELPRDTSGSKNGVQAVGSSQTYGQRYTAQAILGLSLGEDTEDDGRGASEQPLIDADQFRELTDLMESAGVDPQVICAAYAVPMLEQLPAAAFPSVKKRLRKTIEAKAAA